VLFPGTLYIPITEGTRYYAERSISVYEVVAGIGSPSLGENLQFTVSKNGVTVQTFTLISGVYKSLYIFSSTISLVENDYISIEVTSGNGSNLTLKFNYNIVY
jgi:hypothetical protein